SFVEVLLFDVSVKKIRHPTVRQWLAVGDKLADHSAVGNRNRLIDEKNRRTQSGETRLGSGHGPLEGFFKIIRELLERLPQNAAKSRIRRIPFDHDERGQIENLTWFAPLVKTLQLVLSNKESEPLAGTLL